jgi:hypothetical protein
VIRWRPSSATQVFSATPIPKEFLTEFAKLEKPVQRAVQDAIGKFQTHPHAGPHLEQVQHSRDPRIRTIRIDKFWRGVVLKPETGDVYCLPTKA